ncbi:hypothetical protein EDB84DRAFT_850365 [Lactarius hengduanensis]|nr:hypothetical protein EDB84DRAFT_850365 [Lactarius hengduanensis]
MKGTQMSCLVTVLLISDSESRSFHCFYAPNQLTIHQERHEPCEQPFLLVSGFPPLAAHHRAFHIDLQNCCGDTANIRDRVKNIPALVSTMARDSVSHCRAPAAATAQPRPRCPPKSLRSARKYMPHTPPSNGGNSRA